MIQELLEYKELLKLFGIIGGGFIVLIVGFIIQKKKLKQKKSEEEKMNSHYNKIPTAQSPFLNLDYSNEIIKNYIIQYKGTYSRDSIKTALINSGNSESEVENYLNKFF